MRKISVFLIALLVGLVYLFPHLIYIANNEHYNPLVPEVVGPDEALYAAGVQEVLEGRLIPADLAVYEHKDGPFLYAPLPFWIMAAITSITGNILTTMIIADFFFSIISFLVLYWFATLFLQHKRIAILYSLTILFLYRLFIPPAGFSLDILWQHLITNLFNPQGYPVHLWFSRFVHPQVSFPLFIAALGLLYLTVSKDRWTYAAGAGILLGLNFYSYFYFWTFLVTVVSLIGLVLLYKRDWQRIYKLIFLFSITLLLATPYLLNMLKVQATEFPLRSGTETGRWIETISILYLIILGVWVWLSKASFSKPREFKDYVVGLLLLAGVLVLNIQLITGYTVQNNHWNSRVIVPVLVLFLFYCTQQLIQKYQEAKAPVQKMIVMGRKVYPFMIIILFALAIVIQLQEVRAHAQDYSFSREEYEVLQWIRANANGSIIMADDLSWNLWIPAYTHADVYFPYAAMTLANDSELTQRFIITHKLYNHSDEQVQQLLFANSPYTRFSDRSLPIDSSYNSFLKSYLFVEKIFPIKHQGLRKVYSYNNALLKDLEVQYQQAIFKKGDLKIHKVDYILIQSLDLKETNRVVALALGKIVFQNKEFTLVSLYYS